VSITVPEVTAYETPLAGWTSTGSGTICAAILIGAAGCVGTGAGVEPHPATARTAATDPSRPTPRNPRIHAIVIPVPDIVYGLDHFWRRPPYP
jgi:hypothetical protein